MKHPLRVLLVEDSEDDELLVLRALRQSGYDPSHERVQTQNAMRVALAVHDWDVVISDYNMPQFSALEALQILNDSGQDLPFIIVSGTVTDDMAIAGMRAGAHDYLMKSNLARLGPAIAREMQEASNRHERREAERSLQGSIEQFQATFNQAAVGIGHLAFDGRWLLVNQKLCDILGYTQAEMRDLTLTEVTVSGENGGGNSLLTCLFENSAAHYALETQCIRRDGSYVWVNLTLSLARNSAGKAEYCIAVLEDIAARKQAEAEIRSLNGRLQQAMTETHHRVKNSLQIVAAMIEMYDDSTDTIPRIEIERLGRSVRTLAVIHDLLTQQAKIDGEANWLSVRELLHKLLPLLQAAVPNRRIHYEVDEVQFPTHQGTSLALITNELVSNALKYGKGQVNVRFAAEDGTARLTIADDGAGFPADFDPRHAANTGLELVESLTRHDLAGVTIYWNAEEGGGRVEIVMPVPTDAA